MKVAYVLKKYPRLSETFILNEVLGLEERGVDLTIVSLNLPDDGKFHADLAKVRAPVHYLPGFGSTMARDALRSLTGCPKEVRDNLPRALDFVETLPSSKQSLLLFQAFGLARHVLDEEISHLHAHFMTVASWMAYTVHCLTGVPFSVTAHAKDIFRTTVDAEVFQRIAKAAWRVVTVSDFNRGYIQREILGEPLSSVVRIYNGIPARTGADGESSLEKGFSVEPEAVRERDLVLGVGRLVEKKGFSVLLEACRLLVDRGRSHRVVILGEGDEKEALLRMRARLGLEETVEFKGATPREEVRQWMMRARVLAAPCLTGSDGNRDALPTVLLEALDCGLPAVSTRVTGIPEILSHGVDGVLVEEGDPSALAAEIERLFDDEILWRRISCAGPKKVADRFDRNRTLPELIQVFSHSVESPAAQEVRA